jgi:hypothetical protein
MPEAFPSVLQARERAWRCWESDGFYGLVMGIAITLLGLGDLWWSYGYSLRLVALLLLAEEGSVGWITGWLKARVTYPRTGYVTPPQQTMELQIDKEAFPPPKQTREEAVDKILGWTVVLLILGLLLHLRWMFGLFTLLHGYLSWHFRNWAYIPWHKKYLPPLYGLLLTVIPLNMNLTMAIAFIVAGLITVLVSIKNLAVYLKRHPARQL